MRNLTRWLFPLIALLGAACDAPQSISETCTNEGQCQDLVSEVNSNDPLAMPTVSTEAEPELTHLEKWMEASQMEMDDGIPRLLSMTAHGLVLLPYQEVDGHAIVGGDVDMGPISVVHAARDRGVALREVWFPEGHIPWYTNNIDSSQLAKIETAIELLETRTPLTFEKVSSSSSEKALEFKGTTSCSNWLVSYGGLTYDYWNPNDPQPVLRLCQDNGARSVTTVLHELGHALGFPHEFQRADRDDHVDVCFNMDPYNYAKVGGWFWSEDYAHLSPFDFDSIMHSGYSGCITGKNGEKLSDPEYDGDNQYLSVHDINSIYRVYGKKLDSLNADAQFGAGVESGDFDDDGYEDVVVITNEPYSSTYNQMNLLFFRGVGKDDGEGGVETTYVPWFKSMYGYTKDNTLRPAMTTGDFNGDGIVDLAVGDPTYNDNSGRVAVITVNTPNRFGSLAPWGANSWEERQWLYPSSVGLHTGTSHRFGASLAAGELSDYDYDDLLVGAPTAKKTSDSSGKFVIVLQSGGAVIHLPGAKSNDAEITWNPGSPGMFNDYKNFGGALSILPGFCEEKGLDTFVVADPGYNGDRGAVHVYQCAGNGYGSPTQPDLVRTLKGSQDGMEYGHSLTGFRTGSIVSQDFEYFVAIGSPFRDHSGKEDVGRVYVRQFETDGTRTNIATFTPSGSVGSELLGSALAVHQPAASINSEKNHVRLALGAPGVIKNGVRQGKVYVWHPWKNGATSSSATGLNPSSGTEGMAYGATLATIGNRSSEGGFVIGAPGSEMLTGFNLGTFPIGLVYEETGRVDVRVDKTSSKTSWSSSTDTLSAGLEADREPTN